jgi:hypothetical protein
MLTALGSPYNLKITTALTAKHISININIADAIGLLFFSVSSCDMRNAKTNVKKAISNMAATNFAKIILFVPLRS